MPPGCRSSALDEREQRVGFLSRLFGSSEPSRNEIDVAGTLAALGDSQTQVVDCRQKHEWKSGHIAGTKLIPLNTLGQRMNELDRDRPVIVLCRSGHRSSVAVRKLTAAGFSDAKSMKGGVNAWTRAGNELVS